MRGFQLSNGLETTSGDYGCLKSALSGFQVRWEDVARAQVIRRRTSSRRILWWHQPVSINIDEESLKLKIRERYWMSWVLFTGRKHLKIKILFIAHGATLQDSRAKGT